MNIIMSSFSEGTEDSNVNTGTSSGAGEGGDGGGGGGGEETVVRDKRSPFFNILAEWTWGQV